MQAAVCEPRVVVLPDGWVGGAVCAGIDGLDDGLVGEVLVLVDSAPHIFRMVDLGCHSLQLVSYCLPLLVVELVCQTNHAKLEVPDHGSDVSVVSSHDPNRISLCDFSAFELVRYGDDVLVEKRPVLRESSRAKLFLRQY